MLCWHQDGIQRSRFYNMSPLHSPILPLPHTSLQGMKMNLATDVYELPALKSDSPNFSTTISIWIT